MPGFNDADNWCDEQDRGNELVKLRKQLKEAQEVLEWYANWDWSDKYVQAVPKKAKEFLGKINK